MSNDRWDPGQYERFRAQRMEPFFDLVALVRATPGMRVADLGCGTGEITAMLAEKLPGARLEGIDTSAAMLARAAAHASERVSFRQEDIALWREAAACELVFSNAALQWVPDNEGLLARVLGAMKPGAQIAVQVPKNASHPSHALAAELGWEEPYRSALGDSVPRSFALTLERYAELLWEHGFREQVCFEKIYGHALPSTREVVEWVKGTLLTAYLPQFDAPTRESFLREYERRLIAALGERAPYFYPFRRLLFWGRKG